MILSRIDSTENGAGKEIEKIFTRKFFFCSARIFFIPFFLILFFGMDISPASPWKTPGKIAAGAGAATGVGKDVEVAAYALKNLSIAGSPMPKTAVSPAGIIRKKSKCL
jgi:hypothetical protein